MVGQAKQRAHEPSTGLRSVSFARWAPNWPDLLVVALSWVLVAALRTATTIVTAERGLLYFAAYAIVGRPCSVWEFPFCGWYSSGVGPSRTWD